MHEYLVFKDIWSMDKKLFFEKYRTFNSPATHFNQDMTQLTIILTFKDFFELL